MYLFNYRRRHRIIKAKCITKNPYCPLGRRVNLRDCESEENRKEKSILLKWDSNPKNACAPRQGARSSVHLKHGDKNTRTITFVIV